MKNLILILASALFFFYGCKVKKETVRTITTHDTIIEHKTVYDTITKIVRVTNTPPSINSTQFNPCDSVGNVKEDTDFTLTSGGSTLDVSVTGGEILIVASCDKKVDSVVNIYKARIESLKQEKISTSEETTDIKKTVYRWSKWTWIFLLVSVVLLVVLISPLKKFVPRLI